MIRVNEKTNCFHLTNGEISYVFCVDQQTSVLEHLYFGMAVNDRNYFEDLIEREVRPSNNLFVGSQTTSLEHIRQEFPMSSITDYRNPAIEIQYPSGDRISYFKYDRYEIYEGKKKIKGLPTSFGTEKECSTLVVYLKDSYSDIEVSLFYTIYRDLPIITRHCEVENRGEGNYYINQLMSAVLDLPECEYDFIHLNGAWAREMHLQRDTLIHGIQQIGSNRGASSHMHNPFFALCTPNACEQFGEFYGFSLIYSGNFIGEVEVDSYDVTRVRMGINPQDFKWRLGQGETFESPEVIMTFGKQGLNQMSQTFHSFFQKHLIDPNWANKKRPVLLNSWEGFYFDFKEEELIQTALEAKKLGIDLFVLDDGWFGERHSDDSSLGNWSENREKLPHGLSYLSEILHQNDMKFGLWFEPEMISTDTPLYKAHPDWLIGNPDKNISHGRNQYILDFGREEVVEEIFQQMDRILSTVQLEYIKWDMNRYITEPYSQALSADCQGEVMHRYILGVYQLYEKILQKYPNLLIESCAGGGARFDPGMLYYSPQIWTSDDTDAVERLSIQYGASFLYPISCIGSHVSTVPNHQVGRITSLATRANVAMFGTFGYELNLFSLGEGELSLISKQTKYYKEHQKLIMEGKFYRLKGDSIKSNEFAWMIVSNNQEEALVGWYQVLAKPNPGYQRLKLRGLNPDYFYAVEEKEFSGDLLMEIGLLAAKNYIGKEQEFWSRKKVGDFSSEIFYLKKVR